MTKKIWLSGGVLLMIIMGGLGLSSGAVRQPTETIYTALPDTTDTYYQPFLKDLQRFNRDLQGHAAAGDTFTTLTTKTTALRHTKFHYPDIWLRDVAPVITTRMVKFVYRPSYLPQTDGRYLNRQFTKFLRRYRYTTSQLVLDGGNVQWNSHDTVVVTRQIWRDNPDWSHREIVQELQRKLAVRHVIVIPKEPGDVLGHSDGMVKFIGKRTLFVNDFREDPGFLARVKWAIHQAVPDMIIVTLPSAYTAKGQYDRQIASAKGLYINMLQTPHAVYVPQYGLTQDHAVLRLIQRHVNQPVIPVPVGHLSTLGGSVHCLTWEVPNGQFEK